LFKLEQLGVGFYFFSNSCRCSAFTLLLPADLAEVSVLAAGCGMVYLLVVACASSAAVVLRV